MTDTHEHRRLLIVTLVVAATVAGAAATADTGETAAAGEAVAEEEAQSAERGGRFPIDIARMKADAAQRFARLDADGDGEVSSEEFVAGAADRAAPGRAFRGDRGPGRRMGAGGRGGDRARHRRSGPRPFGGRGGAMRERMQASSEAAFDRADADGDGALSREEYGNLGEARRQLVRESMAARTFARLDADDSGSLSGAELSRRVARLATLDADGDGLVSRDEMPRRGGWR